MFLIHGSRAVLRSMKCGGKQLGDSGGTAWLEELVDRRGHYRASVALANKMDRIAWSMVVNGTEYRTST